MSQTVALDALEKRYFLRDDNNNVVENPDGLWERVAECVATPEVNHGYWKKKFYSLMHEGDFLPNSPTLMNAGKKDGQLSACFVLPIDDSIHGIFTTLHDAAIIHKTGGGTGFSFSSLRPEGATVSNKSGVSTGPLAFCQVYDKATEVIKQGSTRRGANMMVFRVDHPDILQFIDMKMTKGVMENFNVSVAITDEFMEALKNDTTYKLKHPFSGEAGELSAKFVWEKIAHNAWTSAEPGVLFIDSANRRSVYEEYIDATNPCGEQWLPPYGSCNLGSINIANFVKNNEIDTPRLARVVHETVRFLDNVIDVNHYPLEQIKDRTKYYRNIGLGPMGWADALIKMKISYNSKEALDLGRRLQKYINQVAHHASYELGKEKGLPEGAPFKSFFPYSSPDRRNATLTNVAPTGTISILIGATLLTFGTSSGIEPNYAFELERHQLDTVFLEKHYLYEAAQNNGGVKKEIFVDSHSVPYLQHVDMQAVFQENVDNAISKTINLAATATVDDIKNAYLRAYTSGCKGCTVYRDGSRGHGVLHRKDEPKTIEKEYCDDCGGELVNESGCVSCLSCGMSKCLVA